MVKCASGLIVLMVLHSGLMAWAAAPTASPFDSAISGADLDANAYQAWFEGAEHKPDQPADVWKAIWSRDGQPPWDGVKFGDTHNPGTRHLRYGFNRPVTLGTIIALGNCSVSVLKPGMKYPGKLDDELQWIPLERIRKGSVVQDETADDGEFGVWVAPPNTVSRAIRFTHVGQTTDRSYAGMVKAAYLISRRVTDVAPQGKAVASVGDNLAYRLIDEHSDIWIPWENCSLDAKGKGVAAPGSPWAMIYWPRPVQLSGINLQFCGCSAVEVQTYVGPEDRHPREAAEADWKLVRTADGLSTWYPLALGVDWLDFRQPLTTHAIRIRMTKPMDESKSHPHMAGKTMGGKRFFLGEIMAFSPAAVGPLAASLIPPADAASAQPPIAIPFTLKEPGVVTLVIEDAQGKRIRNLISETPCPAGANNAYWDGMDDLGRDVEAAKHGLYHVPGQFVAPGEYRVRGLVRKPLSLKYEFTAYYGGTPPWETADSSGGWLTNHTPPNCAMFIPGDKSPNTQPMVYLGSPVAEGGAGLAWVNLDGRKLGGRGWIGGTWTGAQYLCRDGGANADADVFMYVASAFDSELRVTGLTKAADKPILKWSFAKKDLTALNGVASYNGLVVCSLPKLNALLFVDAKKQTVITTASVTDPRGVTFEPDGSLLVLTGTRLVRYPIHGATLAIGGDFKPVITTGLEDPRQVIRDAQGQLYISDWGKSHQVKVFSADGQLLRAIGDPGAPMAGPYNLSHMNTPNGITLDANDRLWVAEADYQPKRVSVWSLDGKLLKAMYGPPEYGGGGRIDPKDKSLLYYNGMEFKLDWDKGTYQLANVFYRPAAGARLLAGGPPEMPHYIDGHRYWCNSFNTNPTGGSDLTGLWLDRDGIAVPVAAFGLANAWDRLKETDILPKWPNGVDPKGDVSHNRCLCLWTDRNGDGLLQADEVEIWKVGSAGGVVVQDDLSLVASRVDAKCVRLHPQGFTAQGVPQYDRKKAEVLCDQVQGPASSGGDQTLVDDDGHLITTLGIQPYHYASITGADKGTPTWAYPNVWPGLHASHEAALPDHPGEIIGVTRLTSGVINPKGSEVGPLWTVNANMGSLYVFTMDGLFVGTLFHDSRTASHWVMPSAQRGMDVGHLTLSDENFWPSVTQTSDGNVYLVSEMNIVRVDGLESLRKLTLPNLRVSEQNLKEAQGWFVQQELLRQKQEGRGALKVAMVKVKDAPNVDGDLADWSAAKWVSVDRRGTAANFDSNSKPYSVDAALAVTTDRLYVAFRTNEANLLENSGAIPNAPFKTGGALDLMIGTDKTAKPDRAAPVLGDIRVLVTLVKGKPYALVYRAVADGAKDKVPFSSPWRTIYFDKVDDVSAQVQLAAKDGAYEFSIPLAALGLRPEKGMTIKGDIGLLRGNGFQTSQRVYWNNKATGITADVPSEAELTPALWGKWEFGDAPDTAGK